jgi:hypothetical protein
VHTRPPRAWSSSRKRYSRIAGLAEIEKLNVDFLFMIYWF